MAALAGIAADLGQLGPAIGMLSQSESELSLPFTHMAETLDAVAGQWNSGERRSHLRLCTDVATSGCRSAKMAYRSRSWDGTGTGTGASYPLTVPVPEPSICVVEHQHQRVTAARVHHAATPTLSGT